MRRLLAVFGLDHGPSDEDFLHGGPLSPSTIGGGITIKGEVRGEGPLTVLGQFEGDIVLDGTLHVGPEARVEILPMGALTGTVKSGSFTAADGARVKGEIWVERPVEDRRLPAVRA
jgi:cytoskeletal protein CcmA (bactofilin family)